MLSHNYLSISIRRVKCIKTKRSPSLHILLIINFLLITCTPFVFLGVEDGFVCVEFVEDIIPLLRLNNHPCSLLVDIKAISPQILSPIRLELGISFHLGYQVWEAVVVEASSSVSCEEAFFDIGVVIFIKDLERRIILLKTCAIVLLHTMPLREHFSQSKIIIPHGLRPK